LEPEEDKSAVIHRSFDGIRFEQSPKWIRVRFGDSFVADSKRTHLLLEPAHLPVYYFPEDDIAPDALERSERTEETPRGTRIFWKVRSGDKTAANAAWSFDPVDDYSFLKGFVTFKWNAMDGWFEEDDEIFVHAKDPYHRIDVLRSSRHVRVEHAGRTLADTVRPVVLFETGLPARYYIPKADVRLELLEASATRTQCPYKGEAEHWSARLDDALHEDLAWTYRLPSVEVSKIENLVAFYQERVDAFHVDDEQIEPPTTPWARARPGS
jgi:uncharacterized protein (DUF427 family)